MVQLQPRVIGTYVSVKEQNIAAGVQTGICSRKLLPSNQKHGLFPPHRFCHRLDHPLLHETEGFAQSSSLPSEDSNHKPSSPKSFARRICVPGGDQKSESPTATTVEARAKDLKLNHEIENIPNSEGAQLHWLGDRSVKNVLLYFHGGGYGLPAFDGHILFLEQCLRHVSSKDKEFCIAFLEYGLTKEKEYPVQILQASESLRLVLSKGVPPSNLIVGGDSAGGNLSLALCSHILHPLSGIPSLRIERPLAGLLLISPWVSFATGTQSWSSNEVRDIVTAASVTELSADWLLPHERNNWSEPFLADTLWWQHMPVQTILNVYGSFECFKDHIGPFGEKLRAAGNEVVNVQCPMHVHIDCVLDAQAGFDAGMMAVTIWEWLEKVL